MATVIIKSNTELKAEDILGFLANYNRVTGEENEPVNLTLDELRDRVNHYAALEHRKNFHEYMKEEYPNEEDLAQYEPHKLYRVKPGAKYRMTVPGTIVAVSGVSKCGCEHCSGKLKAKFDILQSPNHWVGLEAEIDMKDLEEVTIEQLMKEEMCSSTEKAKER